MPAIDVHQDGDTTVVRTELAGVDPKDVDITVEDSVLRISGTRQKDESVSEGDWIRQERFVGRFEREIALPPGVDAGAIEATANNGVIEIRVPRPQTPEPRRIQLGGQTESSAIDVTSANQNDNPERPADESSTNTTSESTTNGSPGNGARKPAKKATKKQTAKSPSARR